MRRIKFLRLVIALTCLSTGGTAVWAQDLGWGASQFRIVSKQSVLHRTGGFAGVSERLRLSGNFDLQILPPAVYPPLVAFNNAEVWGALISDLPHPAIVEDVDELLNLEELHGQQLPTMGPYDTYQFRGKLDDGSSIELMAAKFGAWMYVRGYTTPPPGGADFFEYQLRMVARSQPFADMNEDGVVDAADYTMLRDSAVGGAASADSIAAGADLDLWKQQFGESIPDFTTIDAAFDAAAGGAALAVSAVPEPSALGLVMLGSAAMLGVQRRKVAT
jgi:hypothetical protein